MPSNIAYASLRELISSEVVYTLTRDCSLRARSFDQRGILSAKDKAIYGISSGCVTREADCFMKASNDYFHLLQQLFRF